jgi:transcriptional regulator
MYIPETFAVTDVAELHAFVARHSFATLIVPGDPPDISHLPFSLDAARGVLVAHVARANPVWRSFDGRTPVVVVFQGPHAYVSPRWYGSRNAVPTWNYAVVHAHGTPRLLDGDAALRAALVRLVETHEAGAVDRWTVDELEPETYAKLSQAIVGFEIPIARLEGKFKMSQNRGPDDVDGVIRGLREVGEAGALETALLMLRARTRDRA